MATIYKCDRCGKLMGKQNSIVGISGDDDFSDPYYGVMRSMNNQMTNSLTRPELCEHCVNSFARWWKRVND